MEGVKERKREVEGGVKWLKKGIELVVVRLVRKLGQVA